MSKIVLIGNNELFLMPFMSKYIKILNDLHYEYDVILWNRSNSELDLPDNYYSFDYELSNYIKQYKKIYGYLRFKWFVKSILKKNNYDKAIVFTTQCYLIINDLLHKYFSNNYIFDYRDVTFEDKYLIKKLIEKGIRQSTFTVISSEGFKLNYPTLENKFVVCHNDKFSEIDIYNKEKNNSKIIRLCFWGMVRQVDFTKKLIDIFSKSDKLEINYYGEGYTEILTNYIKEKGYSNIHFHGKYVGNDKILSFAQENDILINAYDNDSIQYLALTVKLYEALAYNIPMIVTKNSYMAEFLHKNDCLFFEFEIRDNIVEDLLSWYDNLDYEIMRNKYSLLINKIEKDNLLFKDKVKEYLSK
jgi:hypothetical protein